MIILFAEERFEKECNKHALLVKRYGGRQAETIQRRLADLHAASTLEVMRTLPGRCHELTGDLKGFLALYLVNPRRLIFEAANDPVPRKADKGLDWTKVTEIRIIGIKDYHD